MILEQAVNRRRSILAVDDEWTVLQSVERVLEGDEYSVTPALFAREALDHLEREPFDLVISDLHMSGPSGLALMREARRLGIDVPFMILTGFPTVHTAIEAFREGCIDYVVKPFTRLELRQAVRRSLKLAEYRRSRPGVPEEGEGSEGPDEGRPTPPRPGDRFSLKGHAWAEYREDGTMEIRIDEDLAAALGDLRVVALPARGASLVQGNPMLQVTDPSGDLYIVLAPLSGEVREVNTPVAQGDRRPLSREWLVRILPHECEQETARLLFRSRDRS